MASPTITAGRASTWLTAACIVVAVVLTRLPQLLSPHLLLDGNESVLGLMARHVVAGRPLPVFFYGQTYGLSVVETVFGALTFALAGSGAMQLKIAMLVLWAIGALALWRAARHMVGEKGAIVLTILLVVHPAWAVWSMKARGGYLTAFAASAALLAVVARPSAGWLLWMACGVLSGVVFLAQPMWLPGLVPILLYLLVRDRSARTAAAYVAGVVPPLIAARIVMAAHTDPIVWAPPPLGNTDLSGSWRASLEQIYVTLSGTYYLRYVLDPEPLTRVIAWTWCAALIALAGIQLARLARRRVLPWSHVFAASVAATVLANWLLVDARDGRYLLPLPALVVFWTVVEGAALARHSASMARAVRIACVALVVASTVAMLEFRSFAFLWRDAPDGLDEARRVANVTDYLKSHGVTRVFSLHGLFQWQLMFYSDETIVARWTSAEDRYPRYVAQVNRALRRGDPVAVVGYVNSMRGLDTLVDPTQIHIVDGKYFVYLHPDEALLRQLGFRF